MCDKQAAEEDFKLGCQVSLARALLEHMTQGGLPQVKAQADRLLGALLARAPGLAFEPTLLVALLEALAAEERLHTEQLTLDAQSTVLPRLRQVQQLPPPLISQQIDGGRTGLRQNQKHPASCLSALSLSAAKHIPHAPQIARADVCFAVAVCLTHSLLSASSKTKLHVSR